MGAIVGTWRRAASGCHPACAAPSRRPDTGRWRTDVLAAYERGGGVAAGPEIAVDAFDFDADGRIAAIHAFIGRGD